VTSEPPTPPTGLRQVREARGLSLHEVAERSGVAMGTLARMEQGGVWAHPSTVAKLAPVLGLTPTELRHLLRGARSPAGRSGNTV
jgi:transcriptional regulator with XRE-family HTH domain